MNTPLSQRQRRARERALHLRAAGAKAQRRRARRSATKPAAAAATVAALTVAGTAVPTSSVAVTPVAAPSCTNAHTPDSEPEGFTDVEGQVFFTAHNGRRGGQLWKTDGTESGTVLVKRIRQEGSYVSGLVDFGGRLFFNNGYDELWTSDGTRAGTVLVKDFSQEKDIYASVLAAVDDRLLLTVGDFGHHEELWASDGTEAGTVLVEEINPGGYSRISEPTVVGDQVFFTADDGKHGQELWTSDGTEAGTALVKDITPGSDSDWYRLPHLAGADDRVFLTADDGVHGLELWTSDGTEAGTVLIEDINPGARDGEPSISAQHPPVVDSAVVGNRIFFTARDGVHGRELWTSDGTEAGTVLVKDIHPGRKGSPFFLTAADDKVFFGAGSADNLYEAALWVSDGTEAGTVEVSDIGPYEGDYGWHPAAAGGTLFFTGDDGTHGAELWVSDGTEAGTAMLRDIAESDYSYGPMALTGIADRLFFQADDDVHGNEPWISDGTRAGTFMLKDINAGGRFRAARRAVANLDAGTLRVKAIMDTAGELVMDSIRPPLVKRVTTEVSEAGNAFVNVEPTARGMRKLRQARREARRNGEDVGKIEVTVRFAFTPCGGTPRNRTRTYTLMLR